MRKVKYLILGAGPSGLAFANRIMQNKEDSFLVLEKEKIAGGLCRSEIVDGSPLDIGGGHFLDARNKKVNEFLFGFMPEEEWNLYSRDSRIVLNNDSCISHPFEANIWQMPQNMQVEYLKSIAVAGCNLGKKVPEKFIKWITWKLGDKIAEDYMIPYNQKMFGKNLNQLGTYWLEKLPSVSFDETLLSCLNCKAYGKQPGHAQFFYPKAYGYGELWRRMGERLKEHIIYEKLVTELNVEDRTIICRDGSCYRGDKLITTIPWHAYWRIKGRNEEVLKRIKALKHTGVEIAYMPQNLSTKAQWLYIPRGDISYHRILVRHNFCNGSKGYWTETNLSRIENGNKKYFTYNNEYAYPLNTIDKPIIMNQLLNYMNENSIYGLGRWGEHEHYNSDATVEKGLDLAEKLLD